MKSLLREERTNNFPKFSIVGDNSMVQFPKKMSFTFAEEAKLELFKNLFLSFDLFIIVFLSSFVIKLQLFERIYFSFVFGVCLSRTDNTVSSNFDSGAFVIPNFNNSFFKSWQKLPFSKFL